MAKVTKNEVTEEIKETKKKKRIDRDTEIKFINFSDQLFIYQNERSGYNVVLRHFGDFDYMTMAELNTLKNQHPSILENYMILLTDVDDDEIELDDIIKKLGLEEYYSNKISAKKFDKLLTDSSLYEDFETMFKSSSKGLKNKLIDRASQLYKENRLANMGAVRTIEKYLKNDNFFRDIDYENDYKNRFNEEN